MLQYARHGASRSTKWLRARRTALPVVADMAVAEATAAVLLEASSTQLQPMSTAMSTHTSRPSRKLAPAAGPTASYRSMAAAQDDEAPMPRSLGASYRGLSAADEAEARSRARLGVLGGGRGAAALQRVWRAALPVLLGGGHGAECAAGPHEGRCSGEARARGLPDDSRMR